MPENKLARRENAFINELYRIRNLLSAYCNNDDISWADGIRFDNFFKDKNRNSLRFAMEATDSCAGDALLDYFEEDEDGYYIKEIIKQAKAFSTFIMESVNPESLSMMKIYGESVITLFAYNTVMAYMLDIDYDDDLAPFVIYKLNPEDQEDEDVAEDILFLQKLWLRGFQCTPAGKSLSPIVIDADKYKMLAGDAMPASVETSVPSSMTSTEVTCCRLSLYPSVASSSPLIPVDLRDKPQSIVKV